MIIPVYVPAGARPVLASERRMGARRGHPIDQSPCPVCDLPLGDQVIVLVLAGIEPGDRKPSRQATGAAVAVHAMCAGVPEEEPEALTAETDAACAHVVDDEEDGPRPCGELSRFVVARSDGDTSFGAGGGTEEACADHLAEAVAGMVDGDEHVRAVVTIRWDKCETAGEEKR
jgi:hypothetical protein